MSAASGAPPKANAAAIHAVRNDRHATLGNAAGDDVPLQALADRRHVIGAAKRERLQRATQAIADAAFAAGAVVDGGILPERANLVDHGQPEQPARAQRRNGIEHRRVRVQYIGTRVSRDLKDALRGRPHLCPLARTRDGVQHRWRLPRPIEAQALHQLVGLRRGDVLRTGDLHRFPAQPLLLAQDGTRAECISALQRNRMIQHVQNPQAHPAALRCCCVTSCCMTLARNASNMSSVHSGAL